MALTVRSLSRLKIPGRYGDGNGLYLQVAGANSRAWVLRFQRNGRERWMGLGSVSTFTLPEARERARRARQLIADGIDPLDYRNAARAEQRTLETINAARSVTFAVAAQRYNEFHSPKWKSGKSAALFLSSLTKYAFPVIGKLPVAAIDKTMVLKVVAPIWKDKNETASRVRGRIENVLDFAKVNGWRDGDNPAAWDGNLAHVLPASVAPVKHHAALPYAELPSFVTLLRERQGVAARALEFAILTAARTGEVTGARWQEVDLTAQVWTVPPSRMKMKREHRVPLTDAAVAILKGLPREGEFVFIGGKRGEPMSNMAMLTLLKRMQRTDITVHGFRSSFRDWCAERTSFPNHVIEMALAHAIGDKVEAAYRRGDLFEKRTRLMADWARYCTTPQRSAATVTALRSA